MSIRAECSPRKIRRIRKDAENQDNKNEDSECQEDLAYEFYRFIIHPMILRLPSQKGTKYSALLFTNDIILNKNVHFILDKLNYSQWLTKLDTCDNEDYKMPLVKMLFISLKNNRTLKLYAEPPVDDLTELNLELSDSTVQFPDFLV